MHEKNNNGKIYHENLENHNTLTIEVDINF